MSDAVTEGILKAVMYLGFGWAIFGAAMWIVGKVLTNIVGKDEDFDI